MGLKVGVVKSRMWFSKLGVENRDAPAAESTIVPHVIGPLLRRRDHASTVDRRDDISTILEVDLLDTLFAS